MEGRNGKGNCPVRREKGSLVLRAFPGANLPVYTNIYISLPPTKMCLSCRQNRVHYLHSTGDRKESQKSNDSPESHSQKMAGGTSDQL